MLFTLCEKRWSLIRKWVRYLSRKRWSWRYCYWPMSGTNKEQQVTPFLSLHSRHLWFATDGPNNHCGPGLCITDIEAENPSLVNCKCALFLYDSAKPQVALVTRDSIRRLGCTIPLTPWTKDYHLFHFLEKHLRGKSFADAVDSGRHTRTSLCPRHLVFFPRSLRRWRYVGKMFWLPMWITFRTNSMLNLMHKLFFLINKNGNDFLVTLYLTIQLSHFFLPMILLRVWIRLSIFHIIASICLCCRIYLSYRWLYQLWYSCILSKAFH